MSKKLSSRPLPRLSLVAYVVLVASLIIIASAVSNRKTSFNSNPRADESGLDVSSGLEISSADALSNLWMEIITGRSNNKYPINIKLPEALYKIIYTKAIKLYPLPGYSIVGPISVTLVRSNDIKGMFSLKNSAGTFPVVYHYYHYLDSNRFKTKVISATISGRNATPAEIDRLENSHNQAAESFWSLYRGILKITHVSNNKNFLVLEATVNVDKLVPLCQYKINIVQPTNNPKEFLYIAPNEVVVPEQARREAIVVEFPDGNRNIIPGPLDWKPGVDTGWGHFENYSRLPKKTGLGMVSWVNDLKIFRTACGLWP